MNPSRGALLKPSERNGKQPRPAGALRQRNVSRYEILKDKIRTWWTDRLKIGEALREVRDGKLYKNEYPNFEDFCYQEFELKHTQAYRLIEAVGIKESIVKASPIGEEIKNEQQARALAKVPEEKRVEVLTKAVESPGPLTAQKITTAARITKPPSKKKSGHLDRISRPIPEDVLADWREAESMEDLCKQVHRIKLRVEKALEENELVFREITNSTVADLHNAWSALQGLIPYAVCPTCEGHNRAICTLCKQRGFLSRFAYEHYVPKKSRELRERLNA